jgi:hypothetical protein
MSLLFCDSFEPYNQTTTAGVKWTNASGAVVSGGRNGQGYQMGFLSKTLALRAAFSIGWAVQGNGPGTGSGAWGGVVYQLGAVNISNSVDPIFQLRMFPNGTFVLYAGNQFMANPLTFVATSGVWTALGLDLVLTNNGGVVAVGCRFYVNGAKLFDNYASPTNSNVNLTDLLSGSAMANYHTFGAITSGSGTTIMDDVFILDAMTVAASNPNTQYTDVGDVGIFAIYPRADVDTQWTALTGPNRYAMVNEAPPDGDASYIYSDTPTQIQTFYYQTVATFAGQIKGAQLSIFARKDNEGSRAIVDCAGSGSYVGTVNFYLGDSYYYHTFPYDIDPVSGLSWTVALINAGDYGVQLAV